MRRSTSQVLMSLGKKLVTTTYHYKTEWWTCHRCASLCHACYKADAVDKMVEVQFFLVAESEEHDKQKPGIPQYTGSPQEALPTGALKTEPP